MYCLGGRLDAVKLALVTETFPPEVNGVAMTLGKLCGCLAEMGWELQVVRPVQEAEELDAPRLIGPYRELVVPGLPLPGYKGLRMGEPAAGLLWNSWRCRRPDLVHVATEGPLGLAALLAARALQLPVSSTFHTNFDQYTDHYRFGFIQSAAKSYLRWVHNRCGCTLAPTRQMADELAADGFKRVGVLTRGVDTQLFAPSRRDAALREEWGVKPDDRVFIYVGRLAREKNIDLAMSAFARARATYPNLALVAVGDGPEMQRLRSEYPEARYVGMRRGEDLARHFASGDVFLCPSVTETFGNVVTEAMASGLAVVTFDYAAGRQCIESGKNGVLARFGDDEDFMAQAKRVAELPSDQLSVMRQNARATAEGMSWHSVARSFAEAGRAVVARHAALWG